LLTAFESVDGIIDGLAASSEGQTVPGVIIRKAADEESAYDDFAPVVLKQHAGKALVHFESFDKAMDAFFTVLEDKKIIEQKVQQQKAAIGKVERVRKAHEASVAALESEKDTQYHKAMLIEANLGDVDNAILVVNSLLSQGTDWNALKKIIKEETRKGNPVAQIIHSLKLDTNQITLQLTFGLDELDEESQTAPVTAVDVDLGLNAYTNAQNYYQTKKKVQVKMEKTQASQGRALKGAERKAKQELKSVEVKSAIQQVRKQHWFEKFIYFVSSENFLVLAGRDAQQNELLVKRHMDKGDVYLHADIHGAATHIIKNHTKDPVPPLTLAQAGLACVCRSAA
ncbi:MAG: NFACT RNA binding domain-containing protein, partial [Promethearchaeia archaeon]